MQEQWRQNASSGLPSGMTSGITSGLASGMSSVLSDRASKESASTSWPPRAQPDSVGLTRQVEAAPWMSAGMSPAGAPPTSAAMTLHHHPHRPGVQNPGGAGLTPGGPGTPLAPAGQFMMNPQLMAASPHNQAFLASATNLMMGMGLPGAAAAAAAQRPGEARFDAYKGVPGAQLPRY